MLSSHEGDELIEALEYAKSKGISAHIIVHFIKNMGGIYLALLDEMKIPHDGGSVASESIATYDSSGSSVTGGTVGVGDDRGDDFKGFEAILEGEEDDDDSSDESVPYAAAAAAAASSCSNSDNFIIKNTVRDTLQNILDGSPIKTISEIQSVIENLGGRFSFILTKSGFTIKDNLTGRTTGSHRTHGHKEKLDESGVKEVRGLVESAGIFDKYSIIKSKKSGIPAELETITMN